MFGSIERRSSNICIIFLHLGFQILVGYWTVMIHGFECQKQNHVQISSYLAYALIAFNAILYYLSTKNETNKRLLYTPLVVNLALAIGILCLTINGYNKQNNCASAKALLELFIIETIATIVFFFLVLAGLNWSQYFPTWPGNIVWPIILLKTVYPGVYKLPAIVIGVIYALISGSGLLLNVINNKFNYNSNQKLDPFTIHWRISMILMFTCQIIAAVILNVSQNEEENYLDQYTKKIFYIFIAVNIIDFLFAFYGYKKYGSATSVYYGHG